MKYNLYIDESGDHGLTYVNPDFPVFLLCGVIVSDSAMGMLNEQFHTLKEKLWNTRGVIFHSRDIRKCEKEFILLFDLEVKKQFYERLNMILSAVPYTVIAAAIRKDRFIEQYGRLSADVYELALSFIIERAVFYLDGLQQQEVELEVIIERRGRREDKKLDEHFQRLMARGTHYVTAERLQAYRFSNRFKSKRENCNGLQLADLVAYPVARYSMEPERPNPAFATIAPKIYAVNGKRYGLKEFP